MLPPPPRQSLYVQGDRALSRLNWRFRRVAGATDILSFPAYPLGHIPTHTPAPTQSQSQTQNEMTLGQMVLRRGILATPSASMHAAPPVEPPPPPLPPTQAALPELTRLEGDLGEIRLGAPYIARHVRGGEVALCAAAHVLRCEPRAF